MELKHLMLAIPLIKHGKHKNPLLLLTQLMLPKMKTPGKPRILKNAKQKILTLHAMLLKQQMMLLSKKLNQLKRQLNLHSLHLQQLQQQLKVQSLKLQQLSQQLKQMKLHAKLPTRLRLLLKLQPHVKLNLPQLLLKLQQKQRLKMLLLLILLLLKKKKQLIKPLPLLPLPKLLKFKDGSPLSMVLLPTTGESLTKNGLQHGNKKNSHLPKLWLKLKSYKPLLLKLILMLLLLKLLPTLR